MEISYVSSLTSFLSLFSRIALALLLKSPSRRAKFYFCLLRFPEYYFAFCLQLCIQPLNTNSESTRRLNSQHWQACCRSPSSSWAWYKTTPYIKPPLIYIYLLTLFISSISILFEVGICDLNLLKHMNIGSRFGCSCRLRLASATKPVPIRGHWQQSPVSRNEEMIIKAKMWHIYAISDHLLCRCHKVCLIRSYSEVLLNLWNKLQINRCRTEQTTASTRRSG